MSGFTLEDEQRLGELILVDSMVLLREAHSYLIATQDFTERIIAEEVGYDVEDRSLADKASKNLSQYNEARRFFLDDGHPPFDQACEVNRVNPEYIRRKVRELFPLPFDGPALFKALTDYRVGWKLLNEGE